MDAPATSTQQVIKDYKRAPYLESDLCFNTLQTR